MAVAVGVIAFAKNTAILFRREVRVVVIVRSGELRFTSEIDHELCFPMPSAARPGHLFRRGSYCYRRFYPSSSRSPSYVRAGIGAKDTRTLGCQAAQRRSHPRRNEPGEFAAGKKCKRSGPESLLPVQACRGPGENRQWR